MEAWSCTQDHEASHNVIAWINARRIQVIGDLHVSMVGDRRVAVSGVRADPHLISRRNAAKVGLAGFLGEARGIVYRRRGEAEIASPDAIAKGVAGVRTEYLSGMVPDDEAWRMRVEVRPERDFQEPVFTLDDLRNVCAWDDSSELRLLTALVAETMEELQAPRNWHAIERIASMIPDDNYATVPRQELRAALSQLLPRDW